MKDALVDITPLILPQLQGTIDQQSHASPGTHSSTIFFFFFSFFLLLLLLLLLLYIAEFPNAVAEAGMALLQDLANRCKTCWSRHMDLRAGTPAPLCGKGSG